MNVACPECSSVFRVDPTRVPAGGVRARCSVCGGVMRVDAPVGFGAEGWGHVGVMATPVGQTVAVAADVRSGGAPTPPPVPSISPTFREPTPPAVPAYRSPTPAAVPPVVAPWPPMPPERPTPSIQAAVAPTPAPSVPAVTPRSATPAPPPVPTVPPRPQTPTGVRQPINPFLANDPNQKAKRLARALVSDIVAYHPQQREQGLREGTLKQLFRDEIKKSYEEYVEQVGAEFAESTSHFQEALNDILAGGRRMF